MQIREYAVMAWCLATIVACSDSSDPADMPSQASFDEHACEFDPPEGLTLDDFRCGTLTTALDRQNPDGQTVEVEAAVLLARNSEAEASPFLFFGGGPGVYNLDSYLPAQSTAALAPINEIRDVVFFDPRGLGRSRPSLACPEITDSLVEAYTRGA